MGILVGNLWEERMSRREAVGSSVNDSVNSKCDDISQSRGAKGPLGTSGSPAFMNPVDGAEGRVR